MGVQRIDNIGISVRDVAEVAAFFADAVGLPVDLNLEGEPPSAQVNLGAQYLYLFQTKSTTSGTNRGFDLATNPPGLDHISFAVDDVDRTYLELRERNVDFDGEPTTIAAWGLRLVAFRDPEGNGYYLVQRIQPS